MRRVGRGLAILLVAGAGVLQLPAPLAAQEAAPGSLTVERIFGSRELSGDLFAASWLPRGHRWTTVKTDSAGRSEIWRVDADSGERERLVSSADLTPAGAERPLSIESTSFSADGKRLLLFTDAQRVWRSRTRGRYYVFDLADRSLTALSSASGWQMFAKFSPDGRKVAFVRDHDLFVVDLKDGSERQLTTDGSENLINGTTDWVYEEELGLRDAFRWSPDGKRIAYWQLDQSAVGRFELIDQTSLYPTVGIVRYPKAGQPNSSVRVGSLEVESGRTTWFDTGDRKDIYLARMDWTGDGDQVAIQRMNRHQDTLQVLLGDAKTGRTRVILTETDDAWVDVNNDYRWVDGGKRLVWPSERDGHRHLYLYDRRGKLLRQLTRGAWDVAGLDGVDKKGHVYFTAGVESPLVRAIYAVRLDGSKDPVQLAGGRGTHGATFSADFKFFFDRHSSFGTPPTVTLRASNGTEVRVLSDNAELMARLDTLGLREPETQILHAQDGTPLNAYIIRPTDFDPERKYPVLMYVYGGPGSQTVLDRWMGRRYLWHEMLARRGILVVSVDNRGTGARGRAFKKQTYLHLGAMESADQLAVVHQLAELPYVDPARIGIWGWSYGGYMTLLTTLLSDGAIAAAVSVAPVTDWKLYDTIYTERYMRTPEENPEGYRDGAPLTYADRLKSKLLLVYGTGDDNVHPQNSVRMVQALENANKQFNMRLYPNKTHSISGGLTQVNLFGLITNFIMERLVGERAAVASVGAAMHG